MHGYARTSYSVSSHGGCQHSPSIFPPVESPVSSSHSPKKQACRAPALAAEPWYVMQLVWSLIRDALQPFTLLDLARLLPDFVDRITRANGRPPGARQRERLGLLQRSAAS